MFIRVGAQRSAVERTSGKLDRNPGNTRNEIILDRGNRSVDGASLAACFLRDGPLAF